MLGDPVNFTDSKGLYTDPRLNGRGVPRTMGGNGKGGAGFFKPRYGPFNEVCGTEGSPWASTLPDISPIACKKHDDCYAKCAKACGGKPCKEKCDLELWDSNPVYGAGTWWGGDGSYFPLEKECGCE